MQKMDSEHATAAEAKLPGVESLKLLQIILYTLSHTPSWCNA
jgi:hypothetical protein